MLGQLCVAAQACRSLARRSPWSRVGAVGCAAAMPNAWPPLPLLLRSAGELEPLCCCSNPHPHPHVKPCAPSSQPPAPPAAPASPGCYFSAALLEPALKDPALARHLVEPRLRQLMVRARVLLYWRGVGRLGRRGRGGRPVAGGGCERLQPPSRVSAGTARGSGRPLCGGQPSTPAGKLGKPAFPEPPPRPAPPTTTTTPTLVRRAWAACA